MISSVTAFRTFIAGTGASGALLGSALVSFLLVAGFLAVDTLPGGGGARAGVLEFGAQELGVGTPGATAVAGAPGAVAAAAPLLAAVPGAAGIPGGGSSPNDDDGNPPRDNGNPPPPGGGDGDPPDPPTGDGFLAGAIAGIDGMVMSTTGVNADLSGTTKPLVDPVDKVIEDVTAARGVATGAGGNVDSAVEGGAQSIPAPSVPDSLSP